MHKSFSYRLYEHDNALDVHTNSLEIKPSQSETLEITDFDHPSAEFINTSINDSFVCLSSNEKIISLILDQSGSNTWNDRYNDRITIFKNIINTINNTYPDKVKFNLVSFGGEKVEIETILDSSISFSTIVNERSYYTIKRSIYENSNYDFAGVRILRRTDRFPINPIDGTIVFDGVSKSFIDTVDNDTLYYYTVFTYNRDEHFSDGQNIKIISLSPDPPNGVANFSSTIRVLYGVQRTDDLKLFLPFLEKSDTVLYDSSGNNNHFLLFNQSDETFWSGTQLEENISRSVGGFLTENGYLRSSNTNDIFKLEANQSKTISFWVNRFSTNITNILISAENNSDFQYRIRLVSGKIAVETPSGTDVSTSEIDDDWTMVSIVFTNDGTNLNSDIFLNGFYSSSLNTLLPADIPDVHLYIGSSLLESSGFTGSVDGVMIYDSELSLTNINNIYSSQSQVFFNSVDSNTLQNPDSGDRDVLLKWLIPESLNITGSVVIVRKEKTPPLHVDDGVIVVTDSILPGYFSYNDVFDFNCGNNYYYRAFVVRPNSETCDLSNSLLTYASIPIKKDLSDLDTPLETPVVTAVPGNHKVKLTWNSPTDPRIVGTKVYHGYVSYPDVDLRSSEGRLESNEFLVVDTNKTSYIHREINENILSNTVHFYTVVFYDRLGHTSPRAHIKIVTSDDMENVFDVDEVSDLQAEQTAPGEIQLNWKTPNILANSLEVWYDDPAVFIINVKSIAGSTLDELPSFNIETIVDQKTKPEFTPAANVNSLAISDFTDLGGGLIKGIIRHGENRTDLSQSDSIVATVNGKFESVDASGKIIYQCFLTPLVVTFKNPIDLSIENLLQLTVPDSNTSNDSVSGSRVCPERFCSDNQSSSSTNLVNGGYANQKQPYIARVYVSFQNAPVPDGTNVFVDLFLHGTTNPTVYTSALSGAYTTQTAEVEKISSNGQSTGVVETVSFFDVEIPSPLEEEVVDLVVTFTYSGLEISKTHTITWLNTLRMDISSRKPLADGIDVGEQFANIYFVDPDDPNNINKRRPVQDRTLVQWSIEKGSFGKDRPFYSAEALSQKISGVYSLTKNGTARNVFFGPVSNIKKNIITYSCGEQGGDSCCIGEEYLISAKMVYNDKTYRTSHWIGYDCEDIDKTTINSKILMTSESGLFGDFPHSFVYADGEELIHLKISSDPVNSDSYYKNCFIDCMNESGTPIINLPCNQILQLDPGELDQNAISGGRISEAGVEVLWNVEFDEDPYTGEKTITSYESLSPFNFENINTVTQYIASIPVKSEYTDVYLRLNKFIGKGSDPTECKEDKTNLTVASILKEGETGVSVCEFKPKCSDVLDSCTIKKKRRYSRVTPVTVTTTMVVNNKTITLTGGGNYEDGVPPVYIGFREPLYVSISDIRINGINGSRVQDIIVDGVTRHTFVVEARFSGKPVPNGTPIEIEVTSSNSTSNVIVPSSFTVYTNLTNDPVFDPLSEGEQRSLAYFDIDPLPDINFRATLSVICRYDKLGTVQREIKDSVLITNSADDLSNCPNPPCTSEVGDMEIKRKVISNEIIIYDTINDTYDNISALKNGRTAQFSAVYASEFDSTGNFIDSSSFDSPESGIYIFGGWDGNRILSSSEFFSFETQSSRYVTSMITPRIYGMTAVIGDNIYCIGGIENETPEKLGVSSKIESYSIKNDMWNPTLAPLPTGVAMGCVSVYEKYIYVFSGITSITDNCCAPGDINTKIYRYDTEEDEWEDLGNTPAFVNRISPFFYQQNGVTTVYSGSVLKSETQVRAELDSIVKNKINTFKASLLSTNYYKDMNIDEVADLYYVDVINNTFVSPFVYLFSSFTFNPVTEQFNGTGEAWTDVPLPRNRGCAVVNENDVYFIGGSNAVSSTNSRNERITNNQYTKLKNLPRGRTSFSSHAFNNNIYIIGGFTSGHKEGWINVVSNIIPELVEADGKQKPSLVIDLYDDSGDPIESEVELLVRGKINIPFITEAVGMEASRKAAERYITDASGDINRLRNLVETIKDPSSDQFQFGALSKLDDTLSIFPVLFLEDKIKTTGTHSTYMLGRSEDPFLNLKQLTEDLLILSKQKTDSLGLTSSGSAFADQISVLIDKFNEIQNKPIIINSEESRDLYEVEIEVTVLDPVYFGQTICKSSIMSLNAFIAAINSEIKILSVPDVNVNKTAPNANSPDIIVNKEASLYNADNSGQNTNSRCLLGIQLENKQQNSCAIAKYYGQIPWMPHIRKILFENNSTAQETLSKLTRLGFDVPFGGSPLFNAVSSVANITTNNDLDTIDKFIYINSDAEENMSTSTFENSIESVKNIDKSGTPIVFNVINTSFPTSIVSESTGSQSSVAEKLAYETNGQTTVLNFHDFVEEVTRFSIKAAGGLGYGVYRRVVDLGEESVVSSLAGVFSVIGSGSLRFRTSVNGITYSNWSKFYYNNDTVNTNIICRYIEFEIVLKSELETGT